MKVAGLSVMYGFMVSLLIALPFLFLSPWSVWLLAYRMTGMPFEMLIPLARPPASEAVPITHILGGFFTWGVFFSSMFYGYLCKRQRGSEESIYTLIWADWPRSWILRFRILLTLILLTGVSFAAAGSFLNEYRASMGCGADYSWPFSAAKAIGNAAALSIPILLIIVFQWLFPAGSPGLTVTLILGVIYVAVSVNTSISDILTGYAACNRKGDGNYEALIMLTVIILWLWMPLYGGATVIESLRRRP